MTHLLAAWPAWPIAFFPALAQQRHVIESEPAVAVYYLAGQRRVQL